jgi:hypothetical protein
MAYNPFHTFRKHQKVWLAALTILTMFVFILTGSSTAFDFFQGVMPLLGIGTRTDEVAEINGKPVARIELINLQQQRSVANSFMLTALMVANDSAGQKVSKQVSDSAIDKQSQNEPCGE